MNWTFDGCPDHHHGGVPIGHAIRTNLMPYLPHCLLFLFLYWLCGASYGQLVQEAQFEIEKHSSGQPYFVISKGDSGILLLRDTEDSEKDGNVWEAKSLDTQLEEQWSATFPVDWKYSFRGYDLYGEALYLLFTKGEGSGSDFLLLKLDAGDGSVETYGIENELDVHLTHFAMLEGNVIFGGYILGRPTVFLYHLSRKKLKVIPGFFQKKSDILELRANEHGEGFNVLYSQKNVKGIYTVQVKTYDLNGAALYEDEFSITEGFRVFSAVSTDFSGKGVNVAGTYGSDNSYYSNGIFFYGGNSGKALVKYHDFTRLEHFFDYMNPKKADRLKGKIVKRERKGRSFHFNSRVLLHGFIPSEEGHFLMAEVYSPQYDYKESYLANDPYLASRNSGSAVESSRYVQQPSRLAHVEDANQYAFHQATVLSLTEEGEIRWDGSMKIDDVKKISLDKTVAARSQGGQVELLYKQGDELRYGIVGQGKTVQQDSIARIAVEGPLRPVRNNPYGEEGEARYWYGAYFFVWGYRRMEDSITQEKKNVFYVHKVRFPTP